MLSSVVFRICVGVTLKLYIRHIVCHITGGRENAFIMHEMHMHDMHMHTGGPTTPAVLQSMECTTINILPLNKSYKYVYIYACV